MNTGVVQIMWKEMGIGLSVFLIVMYVFRNILDIYMIKTYKKIIEMYGKVEMETLKVKAKKHLKLCNYFSVGPWNKQIYLAYNGLCWLLASINLLEENEGEFLAYLKMIKKENEFEMKSFALSLYYRSKKDNNQAKYYYGLYLESKHVDNDIAIIMNSLFGEIEKAELITESASRFSNPAIIKLFRDNEIL